MEADEELRALRDANDEIMAARGMGALYTHGYDLERLRTLPSAGEQQALLQIYRDFCLEDASECADCPFPEQLAQWG